MERPGTRKRDIHFLSKKNGCTFCTHTESAREYARILEFDENVAAYEVGVNLDPEKYPYIQRLGIRKDYFEGKWMSDFLIRYTDGRKGIREIISKEMLEKRAVIEKLEFSRRYWSLSKVDNWKVVVIEREV